MLLVWKNLERKGKKKKGKGKKKKERKKRKKRKEKKRKERKGRESSREGGEVAAAEGEEGGQPPPSIADTIVSGWSRRRSMPSSTLKFCW